MSTPRPPVVNTFLTDEERYQRALGRIFGRLNYEHTPDAARTLDDFRLTHMQQLLRAIGDPQLRVPTVHLAGSKGKGSTATMIARIAEAAGYRVGLFTSPHVNSFEERFTINQVPPSHRQLADLFEQIDSALDHEGDSPARTATFFELATAIGWLHFANQKVDLAVMEVGLGGRLDSTNVCNPLVTVITSISRDHTRLLGNTVAEIAREKAGIIKPGVPVVTAVTEAASAAVIAEVAARQSAPLYRLGTEFHHRPHPVPTIPQFQPVCHAFDFTGNGVSWKNLQSCLPGEHQTRNGALAAEVAILLQQHGFRFPESAIREGLGNARCTLRIEVIRPSPLTIVDAAHNPASITALCETLRNVSVDRRIVIFASSRDKEADVLLSILNEAMDEIWLTQFSNNPRTIPVEELSHLAERILTKPWRTFETVQEALSAARRKSCPRDLICVTGSFFLAAEAKTLLMAGSDMD